MSDESDTLKLDTKNLDQVLKAMKNNMSMGRVGILGSKATRNGAQVGKGKAVNAARSRPKSVGEVSNNAAIGAIHEFGIPGKMPMRSFLRVPISTNLKKELEKEGAFSKAEMKNVVKEGSLRPWLERIVNLAVKIVLESFDTGGDGKWPRWKNGYTNNTGQILVDTQQLRNSITGEVK